MGTRGSNGHGGLDGFKTISRCSDGVPFPDLSRKKKQRVLERLSCTLPRSGFHTSTNLAQTQSKSHYVIGLHVFNIV